MPRLTLISPLVDSTCQPLSGSYPASHQGESFGTFVHGDIALAPMTVIKEECEIAFEVDGVRNDDDLERSCAAVRATFTFLQQIGTTGST